MSTLPESLMRALADYQDDWSNAAEARVVSEIEAYAASQVAAERERCAQVCDEYARRHVKVALTVAEELAALIRDV